MRIEVSDVHKDRTLFNREHNDFPIPPRGANIMWEGDCFEVVGYCYYSPEWLRVFVKKLR